MPEAAIARENDTTGCGAALISGATRTFANGKLVVRLDDKSDHGGTVISASSTVFVEGSKAARLGDSHSCPIPGHGVTAIVSASPNIFIG